MTDNKPVIEELAGGVAGERQCTHVFADGRRCGSRPWAGKEFCWHHDPEGVKQRHQEQEAEGEGEEEEVELLTPIEVHALLSRTLAGVEAGTIPVGRAYAVGYLAAILLGMLKKLDERWEGCPGWEELLEALKE